MVRKMSPEEVAEEIRVYFQVETELTSYIKVGKLTEKKYIVAMKTKDGSNFGITVEKI